MDRGGRVVNAKAAGAGLAASATPAAQATAAAIARLTALLTQGLASGRCARAA